MRNMGRKQRHARGPSSRPVQVGEEVRRALGEMVESGAIKDPRLGQASMLTITDVRMTPDLKLARVYVSVYPDEPAILKTVMDGLTRAGGQMQKGLAHRLRLRFTPRLEFHLDKSIAQGAHIEGLLRSIQQEREQSDLSDAVISTSTEATNSGEDEP